MNLRWRDYYINKEFSQFWSKQMSTIEGKSLFILGLGFDPRSLSGLNILANLTGTGGIDYILIDYKSRPSTGEEAAVIKKMVETNKLKLESLIENNNCKEVGRCSFYIFDEEGYNRAGLHAQNEIVKYYNLFSNYNNIIFDISGLPRSIFIPLLKYLISICEKKIKSNLHVAVVEDSSLDINIVGQEYDTCEFYQSFKAGDADNYIWLPALTKGVGLQLDRIYQSIGSKCIDVCPILPFPGSNLRLSDDIIVENKLFFETINLNYGNIGLCDERNPFDIYRKIIELNDYYTQKLNKLSTIKSIKTVLSPLSSKTLSVGIALAAYERNLAICAVNPTRYTLSDGLSKKTSSDEPMEIWISGDPYR